MSHGNPDSWIVDGRRIGATPLPDGRCAFRVWAPLRQAVGIRLVDGDRIVRLEPRQRGYFEGVAEDVQPGTRYLVRLDDELERPDPASRHQPEGVHGPSAVVDTAAFEWTDQAWTGLPLADCVFYELHVGTFSREGTFEGAIPQLDRLVELGVNMVELMPVAQFPGERNWGYDGVLPFAVQDSYGGPAGLARLVDACHERGLGVCLDVVYNHLGPEGNYLRDFGPYFTDAYHTPWGEAVNLDEGGSDEVRRYFADNALYWLRDLHVDALRLDAVHALMDRSPRPFLQQLAEEKVELADVTGRRLLLIAESDLNDSRLIRGSEQGGYGLDGQWSDDFHHALHALLTGERRGYYADYGDTETLAAVLRHGYAYTGQYSRYRRRSHGSGTAGVPAKRFVVCIQNHDQVGNRLRGDRLNRLVDDAAFRAAALVNLLSPFVPLLFMGEEYVEPAPFPYFVSHGDAELVRAVREGRKREFAAFEWGGEPPDPQSEATFRSAILSPELRHEGRHRSMHELYGEALRLRGSMSASLGARAARREVDVRPDHVVMLRREGGDGSVSLLVVRAVPAGIEGVGERVDVRLPAGDWRVALDSEDERWGGAGRARHADGTIELAGHQAVALVRGEREQERDRE